MKIGSRGANLSTTLGQPAGEQRPAARPEAPLPRAHRELARPEPSKSFLGKLQSLLRAHSPAVAGTLLACAVPAAIGAPTVAHAAPAVSASVETRGELVPADGAAILREAAHRSSALHLAGLQQALLRVYLERESPAPADFTAPVRHELRASTLLELEKTLASIDALLALDAEIPANLLKDLDGLTLRVLTDAARDGSQAAKELTALAHDAPSLAFDPFSLHTAERAPTGPTNAALLELVSATPTGLSDVAKDTLATYTTAMDAVEASLPPVLPFAVTLPTGLSIPDGSGGTIALAAGSTIGKPGGSYVIESPGLGYTGSTIGFTATDSTIVLGRDLDRLSFEHLETTSGSGGVVADGVSATVDRDRGVALLSADAATIDLTTGLVTLTDATLAADADGDLALTAGSASLRGDTSADLTGVTATYGDNGDRATLTADTIAGSASGGAFSAESLSFQLAKGDTTTVTLAAANAHYDGKDLAVDVGTTDVELTVLASGATRLEFAADALDLESGDLHVTSGGTTTATVTHRPDGTIESASFASSALTVASSRGDVTAATATLDLRFGTNGALTGATASGADLSYSGDAGQLTADQGTLTLGFGQSGQLRSVTASGAGVEYAGDRGALTVESGSLELTFGPDGHASRLTLKGTGSFTGTSGEVLDVTGGDLDLKFRQDGSLARATGSFDALTYTQGDQSLATTATGAELKFNADGSLASASLSSGSLTYAAPGQSLTAAGLKIDLAAGEDGLLDSASASARSFVYTTESGTLTGEGKTSITATYTDGELAHLVGSAESLTYATGAETYSATGATLDVTLTGGEVSSAVLGVTTGSIQGEFGTLTIADGASATLGYDEAGNLTSATGAIATLDLTTQDLTLGLTGSSASFTFDADGNLVSGAAHADQLTLATSAENAHDVAATLGGVDVSISTSEAGQTLVFTAESSALVVDGHTIDVSGSSAITVSANAEGVVESITADFPGAITWTEKNGDLSVVVSDLDATATVDGAASKLALTFAEAEVKLASENLTVLLHGGELEAAGNQITLHVDSAEVLKELKKKLAWDLDIENVDVTLTTRDDGAVGSLDLEVGGISGKIEKMNIFATTTGGERIRFHVETDESGEYVQSAFLLIPEGGEVRIEPKKNEAIVLGPQYFSFTNENGVYAFRGEDLDIAYTTKSSTLTVAGGDAEIHLDSNTGELVIHEITGTAIDYRAKGIKVDIDIEKVKGMIVQLSGLENAEAQGLSLHLKPTGEDSVISLEARAKLYGIPVVLELDDVHELEGQADFSLNQVHVRLADPSGRGDIHLGLGPIHMRGSAVEAIAVYQGYDPNRMTSLVGRVLSDQGIAVGKNLTVEPDGVVRLHTGPKSHFVADLSIVLPRGTGATPLYLLDLKDGAGDDAPGFLLELGPRFGPKEGRQFAPTLSLGLLPASLIDWHQVEGRAYAFNLIPLSDNFRLPASPTAMLNFEGTGPNARVGVQLGGFLNPGGVLADSAPLYDAYAGGVFGGLKINVGEHFEAQGDALVDVTRDGAWTFRGARLTIGGRF